MRVRDATEADAAGIAPDRFKVPDEDGFVDFIRNDEDWRARPDTLALVAEVDGDVAGYLEATVQPPLESAPWQSQRDLGETRLLINFVGTSDRYKRQGVATQLVDAAEEWGRSRGASVAICDTFIESPLSVPFWDERMHYRRQAIIFRKQL